ncbi:MAG TPA: hypothetical protein P5234_00515 [Thermoanaerobaculaceae bacterium]|nr:hypothetical protein [Thermoanaerobaculaceae bacterium]HRS14710.1 hypothetical protein [Thermoanaerobaculaceae bacterium]
MKRTLALALAVLCVSTWSYAAYVLILKDGTRQVAREKYRIKGKNVEFVTTSGTLRSIPLALVDLKATEELNARNFGSAQPLDWVDGNEVPPTPTPTPSVAKMVGHLRSSAVAGPVQNVLPTPTPMVGFREIKFGDERVDQAFQQGLESYHLYLYRTSQGTQPGYLFLEVQVNGKKEVSRALQAITTTYHVVAQDLRQAGQVSRLPERVEILLINEAGKEAGVFRITPEDAEELATGKITAEAFFVQKVMF